MTRTGIHPRIKSEGMLRLKTLWLIGRQRRARGTNQPVRLLQNEMALRLRLRKETDRDEERTEHQPRQHDLAVGAFVSVVE